MLDISITNLFKECKLVRACEPTNTVRVRAHALSLHVHGLPKLLN